VAAAIAKLVTAELFGSFLAGSAVVCPSYL